ncbi:hypothetical protein WIW90_03880 [Sulfolobaceae archaeon RB850M]
MRVKLPKEWYEILQKYAKDRKVNISTLIEGILQKGECLNLREVPASGKYKVINVNVNLKEDEVKRAVKKFLFCE